MLVMGKPKKAAQADKNVPAAKSAATDASHEDEKSPKRKGRPVNVWISAELHAAFESYLTRSQKFPPSKTDVVELALMEFLTREGYWPPSDTSRAKPDE